MKFEFKAKNERGEMKEGRIEAVNSEKAIQLLQQEGLVPIHVVEKKDIPNIVKEINRIWEGASQKELMILFREFATLISAKVPVVHALRAIGDQSGNNYLKLVVTEVANNVEDGMPLSDSLARHPNTFTPLMINMIRAGEVSGNLQSAIEFIASNIEKNYRLTSKIRGALFYPSFVITVAAVIGFIATTVILPKLTGIIEDLGVEIPWYTQALIYVSKFMESYWWAVLIVIAGAIGGFIYYIKTEVGKREWHRIQLSLPIVGRLYRYVYLARFATNFSVLLASGIPIVRSLMVTGDIVHNSEFQSVILRSADEVKTGGNISSIFARSAVIPPIVTRIIKIGEETGKMSEVLTNIGDFYEQETDNIARNLATMIEPVMIILLGLGVAVLVFAILMPIYDIAGKL